MENTTASAPDPVIDLFERQTPRSMVNALLKALAAEDYSRAANYFVGVEAAPALVPLSSDAFDTPPEDEVKAKAARQSAERLSAATELARRLKAALDAGGSLTPFGRLSNATTGRVDDGLAPDIEEVGALGPRLDGAPVLLQQIVSVDGEPQWRIAPDTAEALARWRPEPTEAVAEEDARTAVAGAPLHDWLVLIAIALGVFAVLRLAAAAAIALLRRLVADPDEHAGYRFAHAALPPLALYGSVVAFYFTVNNLELAIVARQTLLRGAGIVAWVALAWFLLRLVDAVSRLAAKRMHHAGRRQAVSIITFLRRGAKLFLVAIAVFAVLDRVGLDVTTGLAALGIGGLALALGAQKTIENLVGSVTLIVDEPVLVGDIAQVGDVTGVVEDIGMRSTRIRTNERTVVAIPNGDLAAERIENYSLRDRFLFQQTIGITYDTDSRAMEGVLDALRTIIRADTDVLDEEARVRFLGFGESALKIELFAYFRTRSYPDSLAMQERLLLNIMAKLEELGVGFAFPTRTIHLSGNKAAEDGT